MKAQKLPSGSYRVQLMFNGKSYSFTAASEDEAIYQAVLFKTGRAKEKKHSPTLGECIDKYIQNKSNILSPSTLNGYKRIKVNYLAPLLDVKLSELTNESIQALINQISLNHSPKTTRNAHGFLIAVLNVYAPDLRIRTTLPQQVKHIKQLPEPQEIIQAVKGSSVELPVLLALWLGLRLSEIRGAKKSDIKKGVLTIQRAIITVDGQHIEKEHTKTTDSTRRLAVPAYIQELIAALPSEQEYLTTLTHSQIYKRFNKLLEAHGLAKMPFHDLRHINASIMLALNVPDKYAMERGGWSSPHVMKQVYQSTFTAKREAIDAEIDNYFSGLLHTDFNTK
jgi:integrase